MKKIAEDTPLIKQFFEVKAQHPDAILLYRVGDFYETYSDDAVTASKVLGLVLTKRSNGDKGTIAMAGFPYHALETYLPKLIRSGYKAAVCDQLEDPRLVGRKLVKRGVTEIVTPGVALGESILDQKENNYLAGVVFEKNSCGVAFLDISTGAFKLSQGSTEYVATLLSSLAPKEVLVSRGLEKAFRAVFGDGWYLSSVDEWAFVYDSAVQRLCKQLKVGSLKGYGVDSCPLGICAAGAVLVYLEQTCHEGLGNICSVSRIDEGKFVWMDRFTVRNLEIFQSASSDGVSLVSVIDKCVTPMGARMLRSWLAMPSLDLKELDERHGTVEYFTSQPDTLEDLRDLLGNVGDMERILSRAAAGKIAPREILQLGRGLGMIGPIRKTGQDSPYVKRLTDKLKACEKLLSRIDRTISPDTAAAVGKGPVIREGVDDQLDKLRELSSGGKDYLLKMQKEESERTGIPSLKISYNNVFGYYLEVRNTYKDKVPPEWIRKQTLVSAERYITQELKEYEEQILGAEEKIVSLEARIYSSLVADIQREISAIQEDAAILARLDVLSGLARLALDGRYCRPEMTKGRELVIKGGRHPVIETLMPPGEEYVPNDISMDSGDCQIMILTGPNMAGKSALLRQTALIVLLAQIGSFVPAESARIGWCDKIFTRVGASDNISRGESTFMVEMLETSMILNNLSARSLVLLDEIGRGTSTYDGMSIARAIVEYIHEYGQGAKTLFATHYHELNDLEGLYPRVRNFHIAVKESGRQVIFLRKLRPGGTAHSFGIHVARLAGMPQPVLDSAEDTLKALEAKDASYGEIHKARTVPYGTIESDGTIQLSLFQLDDPTLSSLRDTLKAADLDNMTPLQAFDLLRSMKKELNV